MIGNKISLFFNNLKISRVGNYAFYLGILLLPTAPAISLIFFFISLVLSTNINPIKYIKDSSNKFFLVISLLMILSCIVNTFDTTNSIKSEVGELNWISLINWIPFFWCFWGFKPYTSNPEQRKAVGRFLIIGTIPVIISGLLQYFGGITGPFELFQGLIIWYQRPLNITDGLTGPFNNANYAGSWLALVLPFSVGFLQINKNNKSKQFVTLIISILLIISLVLTNSRNSWIGMIISLILLLSFETSLLIIPLFVICGLIITLLISHLPVSIKELFNFLPINIFNNFPDKSLSLSEAFPRLEIWKFSFNYILQRPFFGWGGGSFPFIHEKYNALWVGHPHNIILELAINYGVLTALLITGYITKILFSSYKSILYFSKKKSRILRKKIIIEKAWFSSLLFITFSHLFDVQYFDLRISIICWILISAVKFSYIN